MGWSRPLANLLDVDACHVCGEHEGAAGHQPRELCHDCQVPDEHHEYQPQMLIIWGIEHTCPDHDDCDQGLLALWPSRELAEREFNQYLLLLALRQGLTPELVRHAGTDVTEGLTRTLSWGDHVLRLVPFSVCTHERHLTNAYAQFALEQS